MKHSPFFYLIYALLVKALILGAVIAFSQVGLSPDEAQYWTWSQYLDWGYYSKPPAIAWQIWGTTALFGNTEFGVRFGALAIAFFLSLAVYLLARRAGLSEKAAFWAGLIMAYSPLGVYLSLAATTDGGAIFFLVLGIAEIVKGIKNESEINYPLAGVWILFGALYKWTAFILWPVVFVFFLFSPKMRRASVSIGVLISLCALLPPLYWNWSHEWATFRHVAGNLNPQVKGNILDFLGAQIGLLSPVVFILLIAGYRALTKHGNRALLFCAAFPCVVLLYCVMAFFKKMQPNWAAYLYPPGMVLIAWFAYPRRKVWLHIGVWISIVMVASLFFMPWRAFRHSLGWRSLSSILLEAGYTPETAFLMGDKYQTTSILSFYGPEQKQAYFFNISASRNNQFSYWPQMAEKEIGHTGYFVVLEKMHEDAIGWYESHYLQRLTPYFSSVMFVGAYPLYKVHGEPVKYALLFKCVDYLGFTPESSKNY